MHLPVAPKDDAQMLLVELLEGSLGDTDAVGNGGQEAPLEEEGSDPAPDPEQAQQAAERAADGEVPGYEGPYATAEERDGLARDKALTARLMAAARRKGVPGSDVENVVQDTISSACIARKLPGGSGDARDKYVFGILGYKIADYWRDTYTQKEIAERAEAYFAAHAVAADPVAERDVFDKLVTAVKARQHSDLRCLLRHKIGQVPMTTIAREQGEDYEAFAKRMKRLWRQLQAAVGVMGGVFALLLVIFHPRPDHPLAFDEPGPVALNEPAVSTHIGETDPTDWAQVLRGEAFRACMDNKWYECLEGLDAARELDPAGDHDPVVAAARKDATAGYAANLKSGSLWRPPVVRAYASRASR
jgi:DNA-directed RNA polymerase specialized sigma24 family protein